VNKATDFQPIQDYMRQRISPAIKTVIDTHGVDPSGGGGGGGGGSAGGTQPPPPGIRNGVVSQNAYVPNKPPTGTGGWVPPKPGSNNSGGQSGGPPPAPVKQQPQKPYKVTVGSAGATKSQAVISTTSKPPSSSQPITKAEQRDRKTLLEAIRRITTKKPAGVKGFAGVPDQN
jgi:hypothetical protein